MKLHEYAPYINGIEIDNSEPCKTTYLEVDWDIADMISPSVAQDMLAAGNPEMYYQNRARDIDQEVFYKTVTGYRGNTMGAELYHALQVVGRLTQNDFTLLPQLIPETLLKQMFNSDFVLRNTSLASVIREHFNKEYQPFSDTVREVQLADERYRIYIINDGSTFIAPGSLNLDPTSYDLLHRVENGDIYVGSKNLLEIVGGGYANESKTVIQRVL